MNSALLSQLEQHQLAGRKQLAVLIDPDKAGEHGLVQLARSAQKLQADYFFVGGSLMTTNRLDQVLSVLREELTYPPYFSRWCYSISEKADGILLLSLFSGRNPEFLIGALCHCRAAAAESGIQILPTAICSLMVESHYRLYISNTTQSLAINPKLRLHGHGGRNVRFAPHLHGCGSGAQRPIDEAVIQAVRKW